MSGFVRFGLLVTGKGEREFLPRLFRSLSALAACNFEVIRKVEQLSPRTSTKKHALRMPGRGGAIPDKDAERIGFPARNWLRDHGELAFVMLIDDLEWERRENHRAIFERYRNAFGVLPEADGRRVGVFFLVMMLEAYYFADPAAVEQTLGISLPLLGSGDDVEQRRHPKNEIKQLYPGFREIEDGANIVAALNLETVLADPATCVALRTAVAWCHRALRLELGERFQLAQLEDPAKRCQVTGAQLDAL